MVTSRKYLDTFSVQCFFSNSLPKLGLAKWVFVDGVQIVLPKGMILKKPVKRVPGQITELPNLQTHRINWWYIYIYHKNQLNILLGKYNGALILCLILWETVLCLPTSTMGTIPKCQDCAAAAAILTDPSVVPSVKEVCDGVSSWNLIVSWRNARGHGFKMRFGISKW